MKKYCILLISLAAFIHVNAQSGFVNGFKVGGGITVAIPVSDLDAYSVGVGIDLLGQYGIGSTVAVTGDIGYITLFAKDDGVESFDLVPIRAGFRYFPSSNFYLGAKIGVGIGVGDNSGSLTAYSLGAGLVMSSRLDVGVAYDGYSKSGISPGYIGLRLGYFFKS